MPFDAFLKIDGIDGESTDDKHDKWIEIMSYSHGVSQPASGAPSAGPRSAQRVVHNDFSIVKSVDASTPKLNLYCSNNDSIKEVIVELCKATGNKETYMQYKMEGAIVTSVRPGGSSQGEERLPLEEVTFSYNKITWTYTPIDAEGKKKGNIVSNWDLTKNVGG
jgi:type VI secretion system secreted protein Hcp